MGNCPTGFLVRLTTGDGLYLAPNLAVGEYVATVEKGGFRRAVRSGVQLQVDQHAQVNVRLDVGQIAETVEVQAEAPLVDTSNTSLGKVVEQRRVTELPLNGRNALALTLLTPSVKSNAGPTASGFADRGIQLSSISINGGPNAMNGQLLDGSNNIQSYIGEVAINPGVDSVEEFKVQSHNDSVEVGDLALTVVEDVAGVRRGPACCGPLLVDVYVLLDDTLQPLQERQHFSYAKLTIHNPF